MAEQLGVMVENYRLRQLTEEMAVLEERQRLARELHDSITQSLYSQTLFARSGRYAFEDGEDLKLKDSLQQLEVNALFALKEMRLLLFQLQPGDLEDVGLAAAINQRLDMVERRLGIDATLQIDKKMTLPERVEETLYRITMEALNNSLKHASANQVSVGLQAEGVDLVLEIVDDGSGFNATEEQGGMGLKIMRERVNQLGGTLEINSKPGSGTLVRVTLSRDEK
jgi:signal transduction histidine kinase